MQFDFDEKDDRDMRQRILDVVKGIDRQVISRHVRDFAVVRTYDRKSYRDHRDFTNDKSPYQEDPMVLIRIEIEVPDDTTPELRELVKDITAIELHGKLEAKRIQLEQFKAARDKADQAVRELEAELGEL